MDCLSGCPDNKAPTVELIDCPKITTKVKIATGIAYSTKVSGLISMPTDTKKTAPNKSFTGLTKCSICSACVVSAMIEPIIKAPNAGENPTLAAKITINKQSANEIISIISSVNKCLAFLSSVGIKKIPTTNQIVKKKINFRTAKPNSIPENCWLTAMVESKTIIRMAIIS